MVQLQIRFRPPLSSATIVSPDMPSSRVHKRFGREHRFHCWHLIGATLFFAECDTAAAQTTATGLLEEILVTAQKRTESLQDLPIAISVATSADLAALRINTSKDLEMLVPNMRWVGSDGMGVNSVFIRGVGDDSFHLNQVGGVGLYMDEVSLNSPILANFGLFDMQRVEVLRGAQNTLFGRNTTGGAIQYVSKKPDPDAGWAGYGTVTGGNFGRNDIEAAINMPVGDRFALRLAGARFAQGDYLSNLFLKDEEGGYQRSGGRAQLLWRVTDDLDALFSTNVGTFRGSVTRYKEIGLGTPGNPASVQCPYNLIKAQPGNGCVDQTGFADSGNYADVHDNGVNLFEINSSGGSVRLSWRLPWFTVTSLTAFEHADAQRAEDATGGPSYIFAFMQGSDTNQVSQEFRVVSKDDAPVRWLGGVYFFNEDAFWTTVSDRANPALTNVAVPGLPVSATEWTAYRPFTLTTQKDRVYSAYGQLEFGLTEKARLTTGLRYTSEEKSGVVKDGIVTVTTPTDPTAFVGAAQINALLVGAPEVPAGSALRLTCPQPLAFTKCYALTPFDLANGALGGNIPLNYRFTDETLAYAGISRGFKAGGVSIASADYVARGGSTVSPEFLVAYELGLKTQMLNNTLRVNTAVFYNQWKDQQLFLVVNTPGTGFNPVYVNVPRTVSYGADVEIEWAPTRDWFVRTALGLLDSSVKEVGAALAASGGATAGSPLIAAPRATWNGWIRREWSAGRGRASLQGEWSFTGMQHFDLVDSPDQIEPSYWIFNARAAYRFGSSAQYELSFWGNNITRTQYCISRGSLSGVGVGNTAWCQGNEATRFFGLTLNVAF
jgi:iron complex outermembrane recepter protein